MPIAAVTNPNPVWNYGTSSWTVSPPPSGVGAARYTVDDLPDPSGFTDTHYPLGTASSSDGTAGITSAARQWSPSGSTPSAPTWHSAFPFKPEVRAYTHLGRDGKLITFPKAVCFTSGTIAHMWADTAALLTPPFTIIMVAIVRHFASVGHTHYLLDSGYDPTTGGKTYVANDPGPIITGAEGFTYRTAMTARLSTSEAFSDPSAGDKHLVVPYVDDAKPRMFFAVFNGANSKSGHYSPHGRNVRGGNLPTHGAQRYLVMGRANGVIDTSQAANMAVFEQRIWASALTDVQLGEQYDQLSSTFRFGEFA